MASLAPSSADESTALADLKRKSVRGGMVTMVAQMVTIVIQLTSTVILARLLSPEDYGIIAMVMTVTAFAGLFRDLGLSSAAIQKKDLTRAQQSNLFWLNAAMGLVLTVIVASIAPLVAWFYRIPELLAVTVALSLNFLISSLSAQHGAMLVREMQFIRKSFVQISGSLVTLVVAVTLALQGFSYWSLVGGTLSGALVTTLLTVKLSPFCPCWPSKGSGIREMLGFGANVTAFDFVNYFSRNLDNVLIGRFWGTGGLGIYSRAYSLMMLPLNAIRNPVTTVAFPALSKLQNDPVAYRVYYRKIVLWLSHLSMPLAAILFVSSDAIIELALGEKWAGVSPVFSVLAVTVFIQTPASLTGLIQLSLGRGKRYFRIGLAFSIITSTAFCVGVIWGPIGVAVAYAVVTYLSLVPILIWAFKDTSLGLVDFFGNIWRPCLASLFSLTVSYLVTASLVGVTVWVSLAGSVSSFVLTYAVVLLCIPSGRDDIRWLKSQIMISSMMHRKA